MAIATAMASKEEAEGANAKPGRQQQFKLQAARLKALMPFQEQSE